LPNLFLIHTLHIPCQNTVWTFRVQSRWQITLLDGTKNWFRIPPRRWKTYKLIPGWKIDRDLSFWMRMIWNDLPKIGPSVGCFVLVTFQRRFNVCKHFIWYCRSTERTSGWFLDVLKVLKSLFWISPFELFAGFFTLGNTVDRSMLSRQQI